MTDVIKPPNIRAVEHGLLPAIFIKGKPKRRMLIEERMKHYRVPGVSIAIIRDGVLDCASGYGIRKNGETDAVTLDTLFQAGSISKPVAAMAALHLVEAGLLNLDEDVNRKLTSWRIRENEYTNKEKVTLRRLLTHSAGLTVHGFPGYATDVPIPTVAQILNGEKPANTEPVHVDSLPGSCRRYSGGGYVVMQQLLSDVTGKPFPLLLREVVFEPLGMEHSTYAQPRETATAAAHGHLLDGTEVRGKWHIYPEMAAAGLWTTPSDLTRFAIEILKSYTGKSNRVLSQQMTRQMLTPGIGGGGLGIDLMGADNNARFGHGGGNCGFVNKFVAYAKTGQGAAIMTNGDGGEELIPEILRGIADVYDWSDYRVEERTVSDVDPELYGAYVGKYQRVDFPARIMEVTRSGSQLFIEYPTLGKLSLHPESQTSYFVVELGASFRFITDENGQVHELEGSGGPFSTFRAVKNEECFGRRTTN